MNNKKIFEYFKIFMKGIFMGIADAIPGVSGGTIALLLGIYEELINTGILYFSPSEAASKINDNWENINGWWYGRNVQNARKIFCERYAKLSNRPIHDLKKILGNERF